MTKISGFVRRSLVVEDGVQRALPASHATTDGDAMPRNFPLLFSYIVALTTSQYMDVAWRITNSSDGNRLFMA